MRFYYIDVISYCFIRIKMFFCNLFPTKKNEDEDYDILEL
jgi:hypothetical protein